MFDRLKIAFPYVIAFVLPLAGLVLAVVRFTQDDAVGAGRMIGCALLGIVAFVLLFS